MRAAGATRLSLTEAQKNAPMVMPIGAFYIQATASRMELMHTRPIVWRGIADITFASRSAGLGSNAALRSGLGPGGSRRDVGGQAATDTLDLLPIEIPRDPAADHFSRR